MIITRTPYRVSFFGGGTDYHPWYQEHGGKVLSTTINHYSYLSLRYLAPFFEHKSRIVWSQDERVENHNQIHHPAVKAVLNYLHIDQGVEIHHQGDLPARSGLGSSSSFTVGLLHGLYALQGNMSSKRQLACEAVHIERHILAENVGVQDQISTAYGGLNHIIIHPNGDFNVSPVILPNARSQELQQHLLLFFTGVSRTASDIAGEKIKSIKNNYSTLHDMEKLVDEATNILVSNGDLNEFGRLLHESWLLKKSLAKNIAPSFVDEIYDTAINAGATGGKLLGAGGGGFMLFFVKPELKPAVLSALEKLLWVPFQFDNSGSQIIFYDSAQSHTQTSLLRRDFLHLPPEKHLNEDAEASNAFANRINNLNYIEK